MACGFDKGLIAAIYDGEIAPAERLLVDRHLATCSECAADLSSMRELSVSLQPLKGASAPMSIAEGVMREIGSTRRVRRPWASWGVSAAAALLLAVGTVYMLDRGASPVREETMARSEKPAAKPAASREFSAEKSGRGKELKESADEPRRDALSAVEIAPKSEAPPPAPPPMPPPAVEPEKREEEGRGVELTDKEAPKEKKDEAPTALAKDQKKPTTPVFRVRSDNQSVVRAEIQAFLKERELVSPPPGAALLGRSKMVRDRYLQLELSEEESKALEKRLASLKATEVTTGLFEDEKKRVAEEEAKLKNTLGARTGEDDQDADQAQAETLKPQTAERSRGVAGAKTIVRKKIILVFEPAPPKK